MVQDMRDFACKKMVCPMELFSHLPLEKQKHSKLVSELTGDLISVAYEKNIFLPEEFTIDELKEAVLYHDIGFVLIPERLQCKIEAITAAEYQAMGRHTIYGAKLIERWQDENAAEKGESFWNLAGEIALSHHEQWNGKGYPYGVRTTAISDISRVVAVADTYDSITRGSCYRMPLPKEFALVELSVSSGKQFDPAIMDIFLDYLRMHG